MYLVFNNNINNNNNNSFRQCYCIRLCSHSNASSSLERRSSRQQLDYRLTAKRHRHSSINWDAWTRTASRCTLLAWMPCHIWLSRWHCPRPWTSRCISRGPCLDHLAAPGTQAYIERVFSVCGLLTQGRRNRITKSLEMRARLKVNAKVFAWTDCTNNVDCRHKAYCDV